MVRAGRRPQARRGDTIVQKLNAEIQRIATLPGKRTSGSRTLGMTSEGGRTPEALDATIKSEIAKWAKVIKDADIKPAD